MRAVFPSNLGKKDWVIFILLGAKNYGLPRRILFNLGEIVGPVVGGALYEVGGKRDEKGQQGFQKYAARLFYEPIETRVSTRTPLRLESDST